MEKRPTPEWLEDATPPWNSERSEAVELYNEMMVEDFKQRIRDIRARSVAMYALSDAEQVIKQKVGLGVKVAVSYNFGRKPTV